ncbi:MAG: response regulator, partial [Deltaproteobacteria bacterium]|nr:response regulator [Deltaproteobacteria bacterium]
MAYKILIVEDSPTMRQVLSFALKRLRRVEIVEAQDGVDGLKKICQEKFDLALIDINMPLMDGLKLVKLIRSDPRCKDVPIAMITTESAREDRERALHLGANEYLTKPVEQRDILRVARKLLKI